MSSTIASTFFFGAAAFAAVVSGVVIGCSPTAAQPSDAGTPTPADPPADAAPTDGATGDASQQTDSGTLPPIPPCPSFDPNNPKHHQYGQESATPIITADETWKSDDVYFIISLFEVSACTLTIEAGTRVCLSAGNGSPPTITVFGNATTEGKVLINGTADRPVIFDRYNSGERYSGFYFSGPSDARFDHVRFNAGGVGGLGVLRFGANHPHPAVLRDVHIETFFKTALNLQTPSGLSADSKVFVDSQQPTSTEHAVVASLKATKTLTPSTLHMAPTIPDGSRAIRFIDHDVREDLTLLGTLGADYVVPSGDLIVRRPDSVAPIPTLSIDPGARVRFADGELVVGNIGAGSEGSLAVNGSLANPVVLTGDETPPARGQWNGVTLYTGGLGTHSLKNVRIENAGGPGGANIVNCRSASPVAGAIKLRPIQTAAYAGPTLENIDVVRSGGDGIAFGCVPAGCLTTDYTAAIKGSDNAGVLLKPLACP